MPQPTPARCAATMLRGRRWRQVTAWLHPCGSSSHSSPASPDAGGLFFAVTICFICALVVVDARRTERQLTLLLSVAIFALALLLASLLNAAGLWFSPVVLLAVIFGLLPSSVALGLAAG